VSPIVALCAFALGAAAIAVWIDMRFPRLAPGELRMVIAHVAAATLIARLVVATNFQLDLGLTWPTGQMVHVFAVLFPTIVYSFLAALWFIKLAQGYLGGAYR
jgi:hypothetical protein